jgi:aldose sugar dehydrogenase
MASRSAAGFTSGTAGRRKFNVRGLGRWSRVGSASAVAALVMAASAGVLAGQAPASQGAGGAQAPPPPAPPVAGVPREPLGDGPWVFEAAERTRFRVVVVTKGLVNPWSLAFLPDGNMLVTERPGRLRLIRHGVLDPQPIAGVPEVRAMRLNGLMDVALHPHFSENRFVYLTYTKPGDNGLMATTLARGRLEGRTLEDVRDLLTAEPWWDGAGGSASTLVFGPDGMLYMTTGTSGVNVIESQDTNGLRGKVLRLRDDGTVPPDNPFVGRAGYQAGDLFPGPPQHTRDCRAPEDWDDLERRDGTQWR